MYFFTIKTDYVAKASAIRYAHKLSAINLKPLSFHLSAYGSSPQIPHTPLLTGGFSACWEQKTLSPIRNSRFSQPHTERF